MSKTNTVIHTMNKRQLKQHKAMLTHQIQNIRADYKYMSKDDIPQEVVEEVCQLMEELKQTRELYDAK